MERGGFNAPPVEQGEGEQEEADQGWLSSGPYCLQITTQSFRKSTIFVGIMLVVRKNTI